jgi:hypothetical protein
MSNNYNIFKTIYLNSNKSSKKTIFSKSSNNKTYNKISQFLFFKNISLIKPKSFMTKKKTIQKNFSKKDYILARMRFFDPIKIPNRNKRINNNMNYILYSPNNKSNFIRKKKYLLTNNSTSNSINLTKASIEEKIHKKIKNDNNKLANYKKEKIKLTNLIEKQKAEIEKLTNKKKLYKQKLALLEKENKKLNKKLEEYTSNQEQLILLIKLIQSCGVDINELIDDYQNSTNININNTVKKDKKSKFSDSVSDLDIKGESNSFIPITIEKTHESKISKIKIPKLNFEKINKYNEINNYK